MFREWLSANRAVIVARAQRATVERSSEASDADAERLFDQLVEALTSAPASPMSSGALSSGPPTGGSKAGGSTPGGNATTRHGGERFRSGAPLARLVHEHSDLLRAALEVADEQGAWLEPGELRELLEALDTTLAAAVTGHQRARDRSQDEERTTRLQHFSHELRNKLYAVTLAWSVLKARHEGDEDEALALVDRNLGGLVAFIDASLAGLRDERGERDRTRISVFELVEEVALEISADAAPRKLRVEVTPVPADLAVEASWAVLADTLGRVLRSACRCSREGGRVSLRVKAAGDRVLIEVEDESGGMAAGSSGAILAAVTSRGAASGHTALEACGGNLDVRDVPGKGCIVALSLPRAAKA